MRNIMDLTFLYLQTYQESFAGHDTQTNTFIFLFIFFFIEILCFKYRG